MVNFRRGKRQVGQSRFGDRKSWVVQSRDADTNWEEEARIERDALRTSMTSGNSGK